MAFGTPDVLGIELGSNHLHLLRGTVLGHRLRLIDFAAEGVPVSNGENAAQQLEALVVRKRLGSSLAALALSGPGVAHQLLDFPSMPFRELATVVGREIRATGWAGEKELACDWEVIDEVESGGPRQIRVLVARAPRSQVDETLRLLERCRLKPALLTTAPISLLRSLKFVQGEGKGLCAVLYTGGQHGYLLGVKDGAWSFYREFSSRSSEEETDALVEEALREANRALLYYKRDHRKDGEIVFLLGGGNGLENLQARLRSELGFQGELIRPGQGLDLDSLKERANIFRDIFPSFMIPLGLVAAAALQPGINLAPKSVRKSIAGRPKSDFSFIYRPVLPLVILLLLLGVHLSLVRTERHFQGLVEDRAALYVQWLPSIRAAEESRALHDNEELLAKSLGSSHTGETSWVVLFKVLSRMTPPELILQSMILQRDKGEWLVTLKGQAVSLDSYAAQVAFNRFYQGLKSSLHLKEIELLSMDISTLTEKVEDPVRKNRGVPAAGVVAQTRAEGVRIEKTRVQFEVRGRSKVI